MKTQKEKDRYMEWLNAGVMHEASNEWLSELKFIKKEQSFFDKLITSYQIDLISSRHIKESEVIISKFGSIRKETTKLLTLVQGHNEKLKIMVDNIDQPKEEEAYRKVHLKLITTISEFFRSYKQLKVEFYDLMKEIIKEKKQKLLV